MCHCHKDSVEGVGRRAVAGGHMWYRAGGWAWDTGKLPYSPTGGGLVLKVCVRMVRRATVRVLRPPSWQEGREGTMAGCSLG